MYPEIEFINTSTEETANNLIKNYEEDFGGTLYPADPKKLFLLWLAKILTQIKVDANDKAKQNIPRYARGEFLDSIAEIFGGGVTRLDKIAARVTLEFEISVTQGAILTIPKGTRVGVDGNITFATIKDAQIEVGETKVEVIAECTTAGEIGNDFIPGQITELIDIFPYYQSVKNITKSNGGAERETDEAFKKRMKDSTDSYSTAGPEGAYKYHIKSISSLIGDVSVRKTTPGKVDIRLITTKGELPSSELIDLVVTKLEEKGVRPLTDRVLIAGPDAITFDIDFTYYIPRTMATDEAGEIVNEVVNKYIEWQTEKLGKDINPSRLITMLVNAGIKRVDLRKPAFRSLQKYEVSKAGTKNTVNGGVEDE